MTDDRHTRAAERLLIVTPAYNEGEHLDRRSRVWRI